METISVYTALSCREQVFGGWCWVFTDQFELRNKTEDPERSPGYLLEGAKK